MSLSAHVAELFLPYPEPPKIEPPRIKKNNKSASHPTLMERILEAQGGFCGICGARLRRSPTIDHVVPRSRGGKNMYNRIVVHNGCNFKKDNRMPTGCERIMLAAVNARMTYTHVLLNDQLEQS